MNRVSKRGVSPSFYFFPLPLKGGGYRGRDVKFPQGLR